MILECYSDLAYAILKDAVKRDRDEMFERYKQKKPWSIEYIQEHGGEGDLVHTIDSTIVDFKLKLPKNDKDVSDEDIENCIILYDALKHLPPSYAANPKFWAYLCHETFYEYMTMRWKMDIYARYFINGISARSLYKNGLSRFWWISHMTYDNQREDPYELTRVILRRTTDVNVIFSRNLNLNKKVLHCLLDVLRTKSISDYTRDILVDMMMDINRIGGTAALDALPKEKLMSLFERKYQEHVEEQK